jgi:hypothetical protein
LSNNAVPGWSSNAVSGLRLDLDMGVCDMRFPTPSEEGGKRDLLWSEQLAARGIGCDTHAPTHKNTPTHPHMPTRARTDPRAPRGNWHAAFASGSCAGGAGGGGVEARAACFLSRTPWDPMAA